MIELRKIGIARVLEIEKMMRLDHAILLLSLTFIASGCFPGSVVFKPVPLPPAEEVTAPPLNRVTEAFPGDALMVKTGVVSAKGFVGVQDYQPANMKVQSELLQYDPILRGSEWAIIGELGPGNYLCKSSSYPGPRIEGTRVKEHIALVVTDKGYGDKGYAYGFATLSGNRAYVNIWKAQPASPILKKADIVHLAGSSRQELVYNGKASSLIRMTYREFKDDLTTPVVTQELSFDLAGSKTVKFRGMTIEVIEATDSFLKYSITSPLQ